MSLVSTIVLLIVVAAAAYTDVRHGKIYNALTIPAMIAGLAISAAGGLKGLEQNLLGLGAGLALGGILMAAARLGGGDAKLMMAIGALKGVNFLIWSFLLGAVAGGLIAAVMLARRRVLARALLTTGHAAIQTAVFHTAVPIDAQTEARMPYSTAIAAGCIIALLML